MISWSSLLENPILPEMLLVKVLQDGDGKVSEMVDSVFNGLSK
jgi:hypothetical protein